MAENSNKPDPTPEAPAADTDFSQVVAESQAAIQSAEMQPPKIGRKRGPYNKKRIGVGGVASPSVALPTSGGAVAPGGLQPTDTSKLLIAPLKLLSSIPARRVQIPELALDQDEAQACAQSLNDILVAFNPAGQLNPKTAAILSAGCVFGMVFVTKANIYSEKMKVRELTEKRKAKEQAAAPPDPAQPFGPAISAADHFKKGRPVSAEQ